MLVGHAHPVINPPAYRELRRGEGQRESRQTGKQAARQAGRWTGTAERGRRNGEGGRGVRRMTY